MLEREMTNMLISGFKAKDKSSFLAASNFCLLVSLINDDVLVCNNCKFRSSSTICIKERIESAT